MDVRAVITTGGATALRGLGGDLAVAPSPRRAPERAAAAGGGGGGQRRRLRTWPGVSVKGQSEPLSAASWTKGTALATRASSLGLMAVIACGPVALAWTALAPKEPAPQGTASGGYDERLMTRRSVATETAVTFTRGWLTATSATPGAVNDVASGTVVLPKVAPIVAALDVVNALATAPGMWAVTVGADVTPPGAPRSVRRYYQVLVQVSGEGRDVSASPAALPAPVVGPGGMNAERGSYGVSLISEGSLGTTVRSYLQAALTGTGDVTRYTSPGADLRGIKPGAGTYPGVMLREIRAEQAVPGATDANAPADGAQVHVQAMYDLIENLRNPAESALSATSLLTLTARGGRWEVSAVDAKLATADPSTQPK